MANWIARPCVLCAIGVLLIPNAAVPGAPAAPPSASAVSTTPAVALGTPLFAAINGDGNVVNFAWWAVKGATIGYELLRTTDPQLPPMTVTTVPIGTLGATDPHPGTTGMYYQLVAIGPGNLRSASAWKLVNTPTVTSVTASGADALVAWSTIQPAPAGYEIWKTADRGRAPLRVGSVPAGTTTFTDKQAAANGNFYQVVALGGGARAASALYPFNVSGAPLTAAASSKFAAPAAPVVTAPAVPTNVAAPMPVTSPTTVASSGSPQTAGTASGLAPAPASASTGTAPVCSAAPTPPPAVKHVGYPPYNVYIDANVMLGGICSDPTSAPDCFIRQSVAYYQAIGVIDSSFDPTDPNAFFGDPLATGAIGNHLTPERGTFERWLSYWGFSADNTAPAAGELRAQYFNDGDLQFGRDMHCRTQILPARGPKLHGANQAVQGVTQPLGEPVGYACYVINSSNTGHAGPLNDSLYYAAYHCPDPYWHLPHCDPTDPQQSIISRPWLNSGRVVVAMEVTATPVSGGWQFGDVSFIAYLTSGATVNGPENLAAVLLDSQGEPPNYPWAEIRSRSRECVWPATAATISPPRSTHPRG